MNLPPKQQFVFDYLKERTTNGKFVTPTEIARAFNPLNHNKWASRICKQLEVINLVERNVSAGWRIKQ